MTVLDTVLEKTHVGASIIKKAKERDSSVYFAVRDAWKTAELLRIQQNCFIEMKMTMDRPRVGFDMVFVDVGGLYGSDGLVESLLFLSSLSNALQPRYIVIKSRSVQRLASTLVPHWQALKEACSNEMDSV
jgi:putative NADH-flavin reductase